MKQCLEMCVVVGHGVWQNIMWKMECILFFLDTFFGCFWRLFFFFQFGYRAFIIFPSQQPLWRRSRCDWTFFKVSPWHTPSPNINCSVLSPRNFPKITTSPGKTNGLLWMKLYRSGTDCKIILWDSWLELAGHSSCGLPGSQGFIQEGLPCSGQGQLTLFLVN